MKYVCLFPLSIIVYIIISHSYDILKMINMDTLINMIRLTNEIYNTLSSYIDVPYFAVVISVFCEF